MANGLSPTGFELKRLETILAEMRSDFETTFGENLNTSPESPDGQIIGTVSASLYDLWEIAQGAYNAFNPSAATDVALSNLVQLNGITREEAIASTVTLTLAGSNGTIIPVGTVVSSSDGSVSFTTDASVTIPVGLTIDVEATATVTGPSIAVAGSVTVIENPITGWDSVTNNTDAVVGRDEESDSDLRAKRELSVSKPSKGILETILAEVISLTGVEEAFIYENSTPLVDPVNGTPSNSFQVVVLGGLDLEIATAIFDEKPIGIESYGTTIVPVLDSQQISHAIGFTRPAVIGIYVAITLTKFSDYPADGDDTIKQKIVDYANGDLIAGRGFGVSDNIIQTQLYTPVNGVGGHSILSMFIGTSPSPALSDDIPIDFDEVSDFQIANITINGI